jgi:trk system potassium uptake protein TrkH
MMLVGGGIGSTAGGMKLSRVYLMLRITTQNIRKKFLPPQSVEAPYYIRAQGKTPIDAALIMDTITFMACYLGLFVAGSLLITVTASCPLTEAMFEFASSLGTVGLSIGLTSPATGAATLIVEMFGMMLGRLEIFIVLIGAYSAIVIIKRKIRNT